MSNRKKQPTSKKVWQPLKRSPQSWVDEQTDRVLADMEKRFPHISREAIEGQLSDETWGNDKYTVNVHLISGKGRNGFVELAIHNHNRTPHIPWRHLQQIKNEVLGPEREAIQIYPAESRLVDTANEFWLYVYPTGEAPMRKRGVKLGMDHGRNVSYDVDPVGNKSRQAPEMEVAYNG